MVSTATPATAAASELLTSVLSPSRAYRQLVADRDTYGDYLGILSAQLFLRGWESERLPPFRAAADGGPDEASLAAVPRTDLLAIGVTIQQLMQPGHQTLGNSPAASGSVPGPTPSSSTGTRRANGRSPTTPGISRRSGSRA
jgi:hypothetical protein